MTRRVRPKSFRNIVLPGTTGPELVDRVDPVDPVDWVDEYSRPFRCSPFGVVPAPSPVISVFIVNGRADGLMLTRPKAFERLSSLHVVQFAEYPGQTRPIFPLEHKTQFQKPLFIQRNRLRVPRRPVSRNRPVQ